MAGTLGDASIFSFNYDKPISLGWGGFALINNMQPFESCSTKDCRTPSIEEELKLLQHFVEAMKYRRLMIPHILTPSSELPKHIASLPKKNFTPEEDVSVGSIQAELGSWALERYSKITLTRNRIARNLTVRLESKGWWVGSEVEPAWLKQRVRFDNISKLQAVSRKAQSKGFRIGNFNWPRLLEGTGEQFENALNASTHWADVPIHQNLGEGELSEISSLLNQG
jgi:dTDP-4-amino-4,6-dideoxygalactose transaminase